MDTIHGQVGSAFYFTKLPGVESSQIGEILLDNITIKNSFSGMNGAIYFER
jgi:hypothetical protein